MRSFATRCAVTLLLVVLYCQLTHADYSEDISTTILPEAVQLQIASNGKTSFVVVIPAQPSEEEKAAARLMADTLKQVTGASFGVQTADAKDLPKTQIQVVQSADLRSEEWTIHTTSDALRIAGGRPRGLFYGVCEFLESHVGVYRFDPFTIHAPNKPNLSLSSIDRRGKPAFEVRTMFTGFPYGYGAASGEQVRLFHVWNKNNIYGSIGEGDWVRHVPEGVHTFGKLISAKEFAKDHPEYFSMDADGKRMTDDKGSDVLWIQLCVTNNDVRRITLERSKKALREDATEAKKTGRAPTRYLVISQNDNTIDLCLCPQCKAVSDREGSQSGPLLDYVNFVARGVREEFPDVLVLTDAYNFTLQPPKTIRPESNVVVRYCDNYGFSDPTRPLTDPLNQRPKAIFDSWTNTTKKVAIWDYWRVFSLHAPGSFAPSVNTSAIQSDLQLFQQRGVPYITVECEDFLGGGFDSNPQTLDLQSFMTMRTWLGMKLLDNPSRDLDSLISTFCQGYFGAASQPMRKLHDWIATSQARVSTRVVDVQRHMWTKQLCSAEFFTTAYQHLDEAVRLANKDSAILTRIGRERIVIDSAYLWMEGIFQPDDSRRLPDRSEVLKRHRQDWQQFVAASFDAEGQKKVFSLIEPGLKVLNALTSTDTNWIAKAKLAKESDFVLDGKLDEAIWKTARARRLVPRDPNAPNNNQTAIRYAWTSEAFYVSVEQPADQASATLEVSITGSDRKGIMLALYCSQSGSLNPYFYRCGADGGLTQIKNRKTTATMKGAQALSSRIAEIRIPWSDLEVKPSVGSEFHLNLGSFPKADSPSASHISSPTLIGESPMWNPAYFGLLQLMEDQIEKH